MSRKEKKIVLYSRNGIKIERSDYIDMSNTANQKNHKLCVRTMHNVSLGKTETLVKGKEGWTEVIRKESPLGFYYTQKIYHPKVDDKKITPSATYVKYVVRFRNSAYTFSYPISCNGTSISHETRPWDLLPGYKGIPDHFIQALYKEINKMLNVWEDEKIGRLIKDRSYDIWDGWKDSQIETGTKWIYKEREAIFKDIFGNPNGPTVTANDIKIEAHGFNKKESFRKRKENE